MKITDSLIEVAIKNSPKNQYGQSIIMDLQVGRLFPNNKDEVENFILSGKSKKYIISTYGWKYGTYKAISLKY